MKYVITGATGHLGTQITTELTRLVNPDDVSLGVHTLRKAMMWATLGIDINQIDYSDESSLTKLLDNADVFIYVPSKSHDSYSRVTELEHVIAAAQQAHVKQLIAMGFIADQANNPFDLSAFYGYLPRRLAASGLHYTILRNALYADPLIPYLPELIERQHVIYPVGDQSLSFISQSDSAKAFAKVATTPSLQNHVYTLTQARNYSMPELAAVLSDVSGQPITYQPVTATEFEKMYNQGNEGHMLSSMYAGGAMGLLDTVSDDYQTIMGHEATPLKEFLQQSYQ